MGTTLLITTYQRAPLLRQSLDRLSRLTLPSEVLVVDDGGDDETPEVVSEFAGRVPIDVRYLYTHNPGPTLCAHARNVGLKAARHDWIITSEPELVWRADLAALFPELVLAHPRSVVSTGLVWFSPDSTIDVDNWQPPAGCETAVEWVAPHAAIWKKEWLIAIGGWDESFPGNWGWDDTDLMTRLHLLGIGQHKAPEAEAIHLHHEKGMDLALANEKHFLGKRLDVPEGRIHTVANRGVQWGVPKARP